MNTFSFVLFLLAAFLFALDAFITYRPVVDGRRRFGFLPAGLCLMAVGFIWQFASHSHTFHL